MLTIYAFLPEHSNHSENEGIPNGMDLAHNYFLFYWLPCIVSHSVLALSLSPRALYDPVKILIMANNNDSLFCQNNKKNNGVKS